MRLTLPSNSLNSADTCSAKIASRSKGGSFYGGAANFVWKRMNNRKKRHKTVRVEKMRPISILYADDGVLLMSKCCR